MYSEALVKAAGNTTTTVSLHGAHAAIALIGIAFVLGGARVICVVVREKYKYMTATGGTSIDDGHRVGTD